jgi:hypothetical protein
MVPYPMCKKNPVHHHPCSLPHSLTYFEFSSFFFLSYIFSSEKKKRKKSIKIWQQQKKRNKSINQSINQFINLLKSPLASSHWKQRS